jgi:hypothetical protein
MEPEDTRASLLMYDVSVLIEKTLKQMVRKNKAQQRDSEQSSMQQ